MKIAGVDLGARKAAVAIYLVEASGEVELKNVVSFHIHPGLRGHELLKIAEMVGKTCADCNYVFVEEPLVGRGVKASLQISQVCGSVLSELAHRNVHTELVNVKSWKKRMVGNGNASKDDVSLWLNNKHPTYGVACGHDQDKRDAAVIGLYGVEVIATAADLKTLG